MLTHRVPRCGVVLALPCLSVPSTSASRRVRKKGTQTAMPRAHCPLAPSGEVADWRCLLHASRPNGLLVGPHAATSVVFRLLAASLRAPVRHWPRDGAAWTNDDAPSTLVLHQVASLPQADQRVLLTWLDKPGRDVQIISLSTRSVYPLVEANAFLASLYYRLNLVVVDCGLAE